MVQQREIMAAMMAQILNVLPPPPKRDEQNVPPPPPPLVDPPVVPPVAQQPMGEMWLLKWFKDCSPTLFRGTTNFKIAEDWLRELEKIFKFMQCTDQENVPLAKFSLKSDAQVWWESMG